MLPQTEAAKAEVKAFKKERKALRSEKKELEGSVSPDPQEVNNDD